MPNHIHGIITLNNNNHSVSVGTRHALSLRKQTQNERNRISRFQNQGKNSLSSIVGSYKSAVTKHIRRLGFDFAWQSRFYDHIIRDKTSYLRISQYIDNKPANWINDEFNPNDNPSPE
jgi:REP element-mobilizing transposase RayT